MRRDLLLIVVVGVVASIGLLSLQGNRAQAQPAEQGNRYQATFSPVGDGYVLYMTDTTSGLTWRVDNKDKWVALGSPSKERGPVGRYKASVVANANGHYWLYVLDTQTGQPSVSIQDGWEGMGQPPG